MERRGARSAVGRWVGVGLLAGAICLLAGCNWLAGLMVMTTPDPVRHVPAEFDRLANKRVVVLVEAEMETLFDFRRIRRQAAEHIAYYLQNHVEGVRVVPPRQVEDYRARGYRTAYEPAHKIGQHFQTDYVLRVELLTFATREEASASLFRGRADVMLAVYEVHAEQPTEAAWSSRLQVYYPPGGPLTVAQATEEDIYSRTLRLLGERVAQKFYDHDEAM